MFIKQHVDTGQVQDPKDHPLVAMFHCMWVPRWRWRYPNVLEAVRILLEYECSYTTSYCIGWSIMIPIDWDTLAIGWNKPPLKIVFHGCLRRLLNSDLYTYHHRCRQHHHLQAALYISPAIEIGQMLGHNSMNNPYLFDLVWGSYRLKNTWQSSLTVVSITISVSQLLLVWALPGYSFETHSLPILRDSWGIFDGIIDLNSNDIDQ